jgi:hypothetical protein
MLASPADIDVFEIRKIQQNMRGYNSILVQSDLRRIGLLLMYNRYQSFFNHLEFTFTVLFCIKYDWFNSHLIGDSIFFKRFSIKKTF